MCVGEVGDGVGIVGIVVLIVMIFIMCIDLCFGVWGWGWSIDFGG